MSISSSTKRPDQQELIRDMFKQSHSATKESAKTKKLSDERTGDFSKKKKRVRFASQELGRRSQEKPRRKAGDRKLLTTDDSKCDNSAA